MPGRVPDSIAAAGPPSWGHDDQDRHRERHNSSPPSAPGVVLRRPSLVVQALLPGAGPCLGLGPLRGTLVRVPCDILSGAGQRVVGGGAQGGGVAPDERVVGEPETWRGRETKARIVAAAAELMHVRGVGATSVDDVLSASGTGKSQLYHYFSSKDDLVGAVLRHQLERVLGDLARFDIGTWDGIRSWLDSMLEAQQERGFHGGCPLGSLVAEVADSDEGLRMVAADAFARWQDVLAAGLRTLQERGELRGNAEPVRLAGEAMASIQGGYLLSTTKREAGPMHVALDAVYARIRSHGS